MTESSLSVLFVGPYRQLYLGPPGFLRVSELQLPVTTQGMHTLPERCYILQATMLVLLHLAWT
jgi:hypothetical protein